MTDNRIKCLKTRVCIARGLYERACAVKWPLLLYPIHFLLCPDNETRSRALGFSLERERERKKSLGLLKNSETRVDLSARSDEVSFPATAAAVRKKLKKKHVRSLKLSFTRAYISIFFFLYFFFIIKHQIFINTTRVELRKFF